MSASITTSSSTTSHVNDRHTTNNNTATIQIPSHLFYRTDQHLFELHLEGMLDSAGDSFEITYFPLPQLDPVEREEIQNDLLTPLTWSFGAQECLVFSMTGLLQALCNFQRDEQGNTNFSFQGTFLAGPCALWYIHAETYASKIYQQQHLSHLYKASATLPKPKIMLRTLISSPQKIEEFKSIVASVLADFHANHILKKTFPALESKEGEFLAPELQKYYFENFNECFPKILEALDFKIHVMDNHECAIFRFGKIEWIVAKHLSRQGCFTHDALIPVDPLIFDACYGLPIHPAFNHNKQVEAFFHSHLGLIKIGGRFGAADSDMWLNFVSCLIEGKESAQQGLEASLKSGLVNDKAFESLHRKIEQYSPEAGLIFGFQLVHLAETFFSAEEISKIKELLLLRYAQIQDPRLVLLGHLWLIEDVEPKVIAAYVQLAGTVAIAHGNLTHKNFSLGTKDFQEPVLKTHLQEHVFQQDLHPEKAIQEILHFYEQKEEWERVHLQLEKLFFLLHTPSETLTRTEAFDQALSWNLVEKALFACLDSTDLPLIKYVVLTIARCSLHADKRFIRKATLRHCHEMMSLKEHYPALTAEIEGIIGVLPKVEGEDFIYEWLETLFKSDTVSQEEGFEIWKKLPVTQQLIEKCYLYIPLLTLLKPNYALQIFLFLKANDTAFTTSPEKVLQIIEKCGQMLMNAPKKLSHEHITFAEVLALSMQDALSKQESPLALDAHLVEWFCHHLSERALPELSDKLTPFSPVAMLKVLDTLGQKSSLTAEEKQTGLNYCHLLLSQHTMADDEILQIRLFQLQQAPEKEIYSLKIIIRDTPKANKEFTTAEGILVHLLQHLTKRWTSPFPNQLRVTTSVALFNVLIKLQIKIILEHRKILTSFLGDHLPFKTFNYTKRRQWIDVYVRHTLGLPRELEIANLWKETLNTWFKTAPEDYEDIEKAYLYGGFEDRALKHNIDKKREETKKAQTYNELSLLLQKEKPEQRDINKALDLYRTNSNKGLLTPELELQALTFLVLHAPDNDLYPIAVRGGGRRQNRRPQAPTSTGLLIKLVDCLNTFNSSSDLKRQGLYALITCLERMPRALEESDRAKINQLLINLYILVDQDEIKRQFLLMSTNKNYVLNAPQEMKEFWLSTIKTWPQTTSREIADRESCFLAGEKRGFVDAEVKQSIELQKEQKAQTQRTNQASDFLKKPSPNKKEVADALRLYKSQSKTLFSSEEEALSYLIKLLLVGDNDPTILIATIDALPKIHESRGLTNDLKREVLVKLLTILKGKTTLDEAQLAQVNIFFANYYPLLNDKSEKRDYLVVCTARRLFPAQHETIRDFWLETMDSWAKEEPMATHMILKCYDFGAEQGIIDLNCRYRLLWALADHSVKSTQLPDRNLVKKIAEGCPTYISTQDLNGLIKYCVSFAKLPYKKRFEFFQLAQRTAESDTVNLMLAIVKSLNSEMGTIHFAHWFSETVSQEQEDLASLKAVAEKLVLKMVAYLTETQKESDQRLVLDISRKFINYGFSEACWLSVAGYVEKHQPRWLSSLLEELFHNNLICKTASQTLHKNALQCLNSTKDEGLYDYYINQDISIILETCAVLGEQFEIGYFYILALAQHPKIYTNAQCLGNLLKARELFGTFLDASGEEIKKHLPRGQELIHYTYIINYFITLALLRSKIDAYQALAGMFLKTLFPIPSFVEKEKSQVTSAKGVISYFPKVFKDLWVLLECFSEIENFTFYGELDQLLAYLNQFDSQTILCQGVNYRSIYRFFLRYFPGEHIMFAIHSWEGDHEMRIKHLNDPAKVIKELTESWPILQTFYTHALESKDQHAIERVVEVLFVIFKQHMGQKTKKNQRKVLEKEKESSSETFQATLPEDFVFSYYKDLFSKFSQYMSVHHGELLAAAISPCLNDYFHLKTEEDHLIFYIKTALVHLSTMILNEFKVLANSYLSCLNSCSAPIEKRVLWRNQFFAEVIEISTQPIASTVEHMKLATKVASYSQNALNLVHASIFKTGIDERADIFHYLICWATQDLVGNAMSINFITHLIESSARKEELFIKLLLLVPADRATKHTYLTYLSVALDKFWPESDKAKQTERSRIREAYQRAENK